MYSEPPIAAPAIAPIAPKPLTFGECIPGLISDFGIFFPPTNGTLLGNFPVDCPALTNGGITVPLTALCILVFFKESVNTFEAPIPSIPPAAAPITPPATVPATAAPCPSVESKAVPALKPLEPRKYLSAFSSPNAASFPMSIACPGIPLC